METSDKIDALVEWAKGWPGLEGYIKLNAINAQAGDSAINTDFNDVALVEYINGTAQREMTLQMRVMAEWSGGFDSTNADALKFATSWRDWVADQYRLGNVPKWESAEIEAIEPLYNIAALNAVYQDEGLAEYLFAARIVYTE